MYVAVNIVPLTCFMTQEPATCARAASICICCALCRAVAEAQGTSSPIDSNIDAIKLKKSFFYGCYKLLQIKFICSRFNDGNRAELGTGGSLCASVCFSARNQSKLCCTSAQCPTVECWKTMAIDYVRLTESELLLQKPSKTNGNISIRFPGYLSSIESPCNEIN